MRTKHTIILGWDVGRVLSGYLFVSFMCRKTASMFEEVSDLGLCYHPGFRQKPSLAGLPNIDGLHTANLQISVESSILSHLKYGAKRLAPTTQDSCKPSGQCERTHCY